MANPENKDSLLFSQKGMLHCGAEIVSERAVRKMETPDPEGRWHPVPHIQVSDCAREHLAVGGYEVKQQEHSLSRNGERWFSLMELGTTKEHGGDELSRIVGLRNSHDKSFRAQVVTGTGVFVCDNLAFNGQINVGRKHTTHILRDMPILMGKCVSKLASVWEDSERRIEVYKERPLSREEVHDLLCLGLDQGFLPSSKIKPVLNEYKHPRHEEFGERNAWSLFNAFTEIGKDWPLDTLQKRTMGMHGVLDNYCGLDIKPVVIDCEELEIETDEEADLIVTS